MYVQIKVADRQDATMTKDMLLEISGEVTRGLIKEERGWWFVYANASKGTINKLLVWADRNEVKIFSIVTSRGNVYYEAKS